MKWTISKKLTAGFGLCALIIVGLIGFNYTQLNKLDALQQEGAARADDAVAITEAASLGLQLYQAVAAAQIDRNLQETDRLWAEVIAEATEDLEKLDELVDTPQEIALMEEVDAAYEEIVRLFEDEMRPLLERTDAITAGVIRELDGAIDAKVDEMEGPLRSIMVSLGEEMVEADEKFDNTSASTITISGIMGLVAVVAAVLIAVLITRAIVRPVNAMTTASEALSLGDIDQNVTYKSSDEIGQLADSFRSMIAAQQAKAEASNQIAQGNLSVELEAASAKDVLGNAMINMVGSLKAMNAEIVGLVDAAVAGKLDSRGDTSKFDGDYAEIIQGVNNTLDAVIEPITEAADVLDKVANRDLTARVVGDYQGDHARIKNSLNTAVQNLDEGLVQVGAASDQVSSAAGQISGGSQALAQGASEQASSLEEVSSSLEEMASMTRQNADNSNQAKTLAQTARESADNGTGAMERMTQSINSIKGSSDETAKIVKTIDEIAFQTNLLALNAAVEAARAGEAGKGFAVVAEEVRNLAQRSAEAAKSTADLIEESVNNADQGVKVTEEVAQILGEIAEGSRKVNDLVGEIAAASNEQSQGIEQVNTGVTQMNQVTQQNAANAEESASAAEELNGQATELQGLVGQFTLSESGRKQQTVAQSAPQPANQVHSLLQGKENGQGSTTTNGNGKETSGKPELLIPLDNDDEEVLNEF